MPVESSIFILCHQTYDGIFKKLLRFMTHQKESKRQSTDGFFVWMWIWQSALSQDYQCQWLTDHQNTPHLDGIKDKLGLSLIWVWCRFVVLVTPLRKLISLTSIDHPLLCGGFTPPSADADKTTCWYMTIIRTYRDVLFLPNWLYCSSKLLWYQYQGSMWRHLAVLSNWDHWCRQIHWRWCIHMS